MSIKTWNWDFFQIDVNLVFSNYPHHFYIVQSARVIEYTGCTFAYDTKQSDGEVPVVLEFWGMRSTPL